MWCYPGYRCVRPLRGVALLVFFSGLLFTAPVAVVLSDEVVELTEIAQLARSGASGLALALIDHHQPAPEQSGNEWMRWERQRIRILEAQQAWPVMAQRLTGLPPGLPDDFVDWAALKRAVALMYGGDFAESRQILRELIWREAPRPSSAQLAEYRHWLAQGYMLEGRIGDALAAMQRYRQDYGAGEREAVLLRIRVLLANGRAAEALTEALSQKGSLEASLLAELAALRSGKSAKQVLQRLAELQAGLGEEPALQVLHAGIVAEAHVFSEKVSDIIVALQHYLSLPVEAVRPEALFDFNGDSLWQAWLDYGKASGNQEHLLIGDDAAWLAAAEATTPRYPIRKRALYAVLAHSAGSAAVRAEAHLRLVTLLVEQQPDSPLLQQLYLHSPQYMPYEALPESVAYQLVDQAIRAGDLRQAAALMQPLAEPPGGTARFAWQMRRAKVFILAADFVAFGQLLDGILPELGRLNAEQRDQLIQLLFDLQTVGEHERAYVLLAELYQAVPIQGLRRELLFWMADSRVAQGRHVEAARLYLQSATLGDIHSMDPWAQTARYQAATSLAEAGLLQDARHIYRQLLRVTESPERRAVLMRELEQLQMRMAAGEQGE